MSGRGQDLQWLPDPERAGRNRGTDRLAALDALSRHERILRRGWAFVIGGTEVDGVRRTVRLPLLSQPVRLERGLRGYRVVAAGDLELTALVEDRGLAGRLEAAPGLGGPNWLGATGTTAWIRAAAEAAGLAVSEVVEHPPGRSADAKLVAVCAAALFVVRDVRSPGLRDTLLTWAGRPGLEATALARVYGLTDADAVADLPPGHSPDDGAGDDGTGHDRAGRDRIEGDQLEGDRVECDGADDGAGDDGIASPLPLNAAQREAVRRARTEPLVVVSGPPGNGKSHALVAAALDIVDRGGSVLVTAQSTAAVEALGALLRRYPGPTPVLFGDAERREAIAAELSQGMGTGVDDRQLRADAGAVAGATARVAAVRSAITAALELERRAASWARWEPLVAGLAAQVPGALRAGFDLARARSLAAVAAGKSG